MSEPDTLVTVLAVVILVALTIYVLSGGADFGGGVWDLLARGPRARAQRDAIAHAIGPIWEANHVWLILVIVVLFVAFPLAFAAMATALHVPLLLALLGIVLRGSAFAFRTYGSNVAGDSSPRRAGSLSPKRAGSSNATSSQRRWGAVFAVASLVTPIMLGMCVGAIASERIVVDLESGRVAGGYFSTWLAPFPWVVGFLTLALVAFLAAVYLTVEVENSELKDDFRLRALLAGLAVAVCLAIGHGLAGTSAPAIREALEHRSWWLMIAVTVFWIGSLVALWRRRWHLARVLAIVLGCLIVWGWAFAQYPHVVPPTLTFQNTAAPDSVLRFLLVSLAVGGVLTAPSLWYLYRLFKQKSGPHELRSTTSRE